MSLARMFLQEYFKKLICNIILTINVNTTKINVAIKMENIYLGSLIDLGTVVNEDLIVPVHVMQSFRVRGSTEKTCLRSFRSYSFVFIIPNLAKCN